MNKKSGPLSLSEQAYQHIKEKIVSLELPPGAVISEGSLMEELGLGRTPIREALQRLSLEKLVVIIPRRGMFVSDIRITDLQRLFEVRMVLEGYGARLAAQRATEEQWSRMEAVLAHLPDETEPVGNRTMITIDQRFHHLIYEATDNEFLEDILTTLYALSLRLWYLSLDRIGPMWAAVAQHQEILEALRDRDPDRAERLMRQHVLEFQEKIKASL